MDDTRLSAARYLDLLHEEGERLLLAAEGAMDLPVPACEGWAVRDVVEHVGMVYGHKIAALELGRRPEPGEWQGPEPGVDEIAWCHGLLHRLASDLSRRRGRRAGLDLVGARPDGRLLAAPDGAGDGRAPGRRRECRAARSPRSRATSRSTASTSCCASCSPTWASRTSAGPVRDGDRVRVVVAGTTVAGDASDLLLWLWGRAPDGAVEVAGDEAEAAGPAPLRHPVRARRRVGR